MNFVHFKHIPLQFLAILNMLAALAYISHASSTLLFPLKDGEHSVSFYVIHQFKFQVLYT